MAIHNDMLRIRAMESIVQSYLLEHTHTDGTVDEGIVYEDEYVLMDIKDGQLYMTGKPFRSPFQYTMTGVS